MVAHTLSFILLRAFQARRNKTLGGGVRQFRAVAETTLRSGGRYGVICHFSHKQYNILHPFLQGGFAPSWHQFMPKLHIQQNFVKELQKMIVQSVVFHESAFPAPAAGGMPYQGVAFPAFA